MSTDTPTPGGTTAVRVDAVHDHGSIARCTGRLVVPPYTRVTFYADHRMAVPIAEHVRYAQEDGDLPVADVPNWNLEPRSTT